MSDVVQCFRRICRSMFSVMPNNIYKSVGDVILLCVPTMTEIHDSNSEVKKVPEGFQDQSSRLSRLRLVFTFSGLALGYFLSFLDQTSVATAIPSIATDLNAGRR